MCVFLEKWTQRNSGSLFSGHNMQQTVPVKSQYHISICDFSGIMAERWGSAIWPSHFGNRVQAVRIWPDQSVCLAKGRGAARTNATGWGRGHGRLTGGQTSHPMIFRGFSLFAGTFTQAHFHVTSYPSLMRKVPSAESSTRLYGSLTN